MSLIDEFMSRYVKEYDFYSQAARLSAQVLERELRTSGIRCIVTHRAKDAARLADKCRQRGSMTGYETIEDIYQDVVDLAGVRVALYFPGEQDQVDKIVKRLFRLQEPKKEFPATNEAGSGKRFSGYHAAHYRVQLAEQELSEPDKRYAKARVEIQVASVLMHAWSEVEHDLIYKPLGGDLSDQELSILDQLNGLVMAGEMSLQMLQEAGEVRVTSTGRSFLNHYELAAHLISHATGFLGAPVEDSGLGRVDLLFALLDRLEITTPSDLAPYLESLHENLEERPLAEQVIDAILAEDSSRYKVFESITADSRDTAWVDTGGEGSRRDELMGRFLAAWIELEEIIRSFAPVADRNIARVPLRTLLENIPYMDPDTHREIDGLRRVRNNLVHGAEISADRSLSDALERLRVLTLRLREMKRPDHKD